MNKAKVFLEIEVEINKDNPNDKGLSLAEIAKYACGGICESVRRALEKNNRKSKIINSKYEYTIVGKCS